MDSYTLNTVNYNYKTLSHEGFGGVCKYIATPKSVGYSRLLVKHENIQSACNTFMCSRLAELCDVYTPKAYLMSTSNETRRLFPMHPFIVGTEWVEDFFCGRLWQHKRVPGTASAVFGQYGSVCNVLPDRRHAAVCILTRQGRIRLRLGRSV